MTRPRAPATATRASTTSARRGQAPGDGRRRCRPRRCWPRAARARSTPRAASRRSCSSWTAARSRSWSRGWARSRSSRARCSSEQGDQSLRRRRLRHGRGDRQRPLLRRRAAAGRQRLLRHRLLGVVSRAPSAPRALLEGWRRACADAGCAWGGGESPSLPGLRRRARDRARGRRRRRACRRGARRSSARSWAAGDEIVLVASSGLHANGASLARLVAGRLPDGYATALPSGRDARRGAARARR